MIECPKCKNKHEPEGDGEAEQGKWICDKCNFAFIVEVEYEPVYSVECDEHEFIEKKYGDNPNHPNLKFCRLCGKAEAFKVGQGVKNELSDD